MRKIASELHPKETFFIDRTPRNCSAPPYDCSASLTLEVPPHALSLSKNWRSVIRQNILAVRHENNFLYFETLMAELIRNLCSAYGEAPRLSDKESEISRWGDKIVRSGDSTKSRCILHQRGNANYFRVELKQLWCQCLFWQSVAKIEGRRVPSTGAKSRKIAMLPVVCESEFLEKRFSILWTLSQ